MTVHGGVPNGTALGDTCVTGVNLGHDAFPWLAWICPGPVPGVQVLMSLLE